MAVEDGAGLMMAVDEGGGQVGGNPVTAEERAVVVVRDTTVKVLCTIASTFDRRR